jgi:hypothetical protein
MSRMPKMCALFITTVLFAIAARAAVPEQTRTAIDRALQLARAVRHALDVQVGAASPASKERI